MSDRYQPSEAISKEAKSVLAECTTLGQFDHFAALVSQQLGQQSALRKGQRGSRHVVSLVFHTHLLLGLAVLDPRALTARLPLSLKSRLRSFQCRCHRVSQRQSYGDYNYAEGDKLDQIIWPFSVGISIAEETRSSHAQRVGSFHIYSSPFTNEITIFMQ
jgi:hypothetical protein